MAVRDFFISIGEDLAGINQEEPVRTKLVPVVPKIETGTGAAPVVELSPSRSRRRDLGEGVPFGRGADLGRAL